MRTRRARQTSTGLVLAALVALTGCSAGTPLPAETIPTPTGSVQPSVVTPADGVSLAALGFSNGPVTRVFLPLDVQISSRVDQTNNVTLVMRQPSPAELAGYLRRTLPANGFTLTADERATTTLTFAGFGWTGTFTGDAAASALLLRPAG